METTEELSGLNRAQLLEKCRARGLAATAWKKERMLQALVSGEAPPAKAAAKPAREPGEAQPNALAHQLRRRSEDEGHDAAARKARENMSGRTGRCVSANGCRCEAYEAGDRDAFGWQMCQCQHTQWTHSPGGGA